MPGATQKLKKSIYHLHPSYKMVEAGLKNLEQRTGKDLKYWIALVQKQCPGDLKRRREWLALEHGFTTNYAWWVAEESLGKSSAPEDYDPDLYVKAMFAGREQLLHLYDELLKIALAAGPEAKACPCETIVPIYRNHVIAEIKPATKSRLDFGFALGSMKAEGRLISTGGLEKKNRITHRIPVASKSDIQGDIKRFLKIAYTNDGPEA